jgi:deoxyadenosine/deoxycytidine kinase
MVQFSDAIIVLMKKFIVVAGNIGVGKTSLVDLLSKKIDWQPFYEPVAQNPYISDFYNDMQTWAFHSQIYFLGHRLKIHRQLSQISGSVIQDRSVYEDAEIFARNLYEQGNFTERDFQTYCGLYHTLLEFLPAPDLVIYLRASVPILQTRIKLRQRDYEKDIPTEYLERLNSLYERWINDFTLCPVLTVPADNLDFVMRQDHLELIASKVLEKLTGKDEVIFTQSEIGK